MKWLSDEAVKGLRSLIELPDLSGTRYELLGKVATGGMGTVYLAEDTLLGRRVAIKVMHAAQSADFASRMMREARVVARLEHPGIVPVHDVGTLPDGRVFYVMKFVEGSSLDKYIRGGVTRIDRLRIFQRICEAVAFANSNGVLHRDLKPENVMVGPFGEVLVMDWGIARIIDSNEDAEGNGIESGSHIGEVDGLETADGVIVGTPGYMAPEQARGERASVDQRADVYALGAMLFFLLTGKHPSRGDGGPEAPGRPRTINRDLPRALKAICMNAMAPLKQDRYESAEELEADIGRYLAGEAVSAYRENLLERSGRWISRNRFVTGLILAYILMRVLIFAFFER